MWRRHSNAAGASLIQGDATVLPGIAVSPAAFNSSCSGENGTAQTCIASAIACETMLTVKTSVRRMLRPVSLNRMSGWFSTPSARIGGSADRQLKKLNGAALIRPSGSTVVTSAIGRGTTVPISSLYLSRADISRKSKVTSPGS